MIVVYMERSNGISSVRMKGLPKLFKDLDGRGHPYWRIVREGKFTTEGLNKYVTTLHAQLVQWPDMECEAIAESTD